MLLHIHKPIAKLTVNHLFITLIIKFYCHIFSDICVTAFKVSTDKTV